MITFENVHFQYGNSTIIENFSVEVEDGDFVAVIGANGAGKSTLSKLCSGLLKPTAGRVVVHGMDTKAVRASQLARHIGFLFQNPDRQICQNTVRAELLFGLTYTCPDEAERTRRCDAMLERFGLDGAVDPFSLSRGERQRVALASILVCDPALLILDEPTTGLDYRECMEIMELVRELNTQGTTIFMVTHDMEIVQDFAKNVLVVNSGERVGYGAIDTIMTDGELLARASVMPPQMTALGLRLGGELVHCATPQAMAEAIERRCR